MKFVRQVGLLTLTGLRGLGKRRGASLVTVISVTTVVGVLVSLLAIGEGTKIFSGRAAQSDIAVVVGRGARSAFDSVLTRDAVLAIEDTDGLKRAADGKPYAYAFSLVPVDVVKKNGKRGTVYLVGYTDGWRLVDQNIRVVEGRLYKPALHELMVSDPIRKMYRNMDIGSHLTLRGTEWTVVGVFAGSGSVGDSLLRADADTVMSAFGRNTFGQVNVTLESPNAFERFKSALNANPTLSVEAKTEAQQFEESFGQLNSLLSFIAYFIGGVMASGAVCGALNSVYASIDSRRREIATLRAIGFSGAPLITSILIESMLLALPGAFLGACIAWLLFNGNVVSTGGLIFKLTVTPRLLEISIFWALAIGLIGGSLPALRASRLPVSRALQAT
jgi:putative ABC transport system permease protein